MNFDAKEVAATAKDGDLANGSSPDEPGGVKITFPSAHACISPETDNTRVRAFRRAFFPSAGDDVWNDWTWQLRHSVTRRDQLARFIRLTDREAGAAALLAGRLPLRITPYYLSLIDSNDSGDPIRRMMVPTPDELQTWPEERSDSLNEQGSTPVPGLIHRYPDRVLFLVTQFCSSYCRYCTRSHSVGRLAHGSSLRWKAALQYIAAHTEVRDVLISGGDPFTLDDARLEYLLSELRKIGHVEMIRIGTKVPVVLPMWVTPALTAMLRKYHPLWISIHFSHPDEITPETAQACTMLADAGIPLGSQTVLLRGINDDAAVMRQLFHRLLTIRVRPYYLYQCDLIPGSRHFRTPVSAGLEIIRSLRGFTSGYAIPHFVIDAPGGGGKIPLLPDSMVSSGDGGLILRNYQGNLYTYPEP